MQAPSATAPSPTFFIPKPSHPLSTPFAPTIPLSLHRPTLNRLLWNLFKYFDISPPLTSRAEMICDSWRWARSEELPPTPCLPFPPPSFFVERPIFLFWLPSFFFFPLLLYSPLLLLSAGEGLESSSRFFFFFFPCDSTVWWTNWVIFLYLLTFCVCCLFFLCLLLSAHLLFDPVLTPCMAAQRVILLRLSCESSEATGQQNGSFYCFLED